MNKEQLIQQLRQEGLWAKKGLGQNFLVDEEALGKIVDAAELNKDDTVLEIGPGLGVLTERLVESAGEVIAIEMDEKLADLLSKKLEVKSHLPVEASLKAMQAGNCNSKVKIIKGDALDFDPSTIKKGSLQQGPQGHSGKDRDDSPDTYKLVANIPYYITGKIIEKYLTAENRPSLIVLLVQKEVAERICAKPGKLSVLAISVQLYGEPEIVGIVPGSSFYPAPKVDSAILRIRIKNQELRIENEKELFKYIKMGFGSKRRTLVNNLSGGLHVTKDVIESVLTDLGLNPMARAQELSVDDWIALIDKLKELK